MAQTYPSTADRKKPAVDERHLRKEDLANCGPDVPLLKKTLIGCCIILVLVVIISVSMLISVPEKISFVSGIWTAMSMDLSAGVLYRPMVDANGYGGTRYFPLHVILQTLLAPLVGGHWAAGHLIAILSGIAIISAIATILRWLNVKSWLAWSGGILILATATMQSGLTEIKPDLLSVALGLWGVAFTAKPYVKKSHTICSIIFLALAFFAKITSLTFMVVAVGYEFFAGRKKQALVTALGVCLLGAILVFGYNWLSGGAFLNVAMACSNAGQSPVGLFSPRGAMNLLKFATVRDPLTGLLLGAAAIVFIFNIRRCLKQLPMILFLVMLVGVIVIFNSTGTRFNHLIDVSVASIILIASAVSVQKHILKTGLILFVLVALGGSVYAGLRSQRYEELAASRKKVSLAIEEASKSGKPIFTTDPTPLVLSGRRSYLLEPFMLTQIVFKQQKIKQGFIEDIKSQKFGLIILNVAPNASKDDLQLQNYLDKESAENLLQFYRPVNRHYIYQIYEPIKDDSQP